jgi:predicted phage terminase large subunit-like protein
MASCAYFIAEIFGYTIAVPHKNILAHFEQHQETLDLAPRGVGKTYIGNIGYTTWRIVNNQDLRILVLSDTDWHAIRFVTPVKIALESNPTLRRIYGNLRGDKWTDHELTLRTRQHPFAEASITALGMYSGAVTSGHYDLIIADDLINFDNSRTEGQRERSKEWFKTTLLPTLLPGGEIHIVGTRYHYNDLWQMVIEQLGYHTQIQRAIQEDGSSIWEDHLPLHDTVYQGRRKEGLSSIQNKLGSIIFNLQYQNDVQLMKTGRIFRYDWFNFYEAIPDKLHIFMGVDPAISQKSTADFFVIIIIGVDEDGKIYVLDIFRERCTFDEQVHHITRLADQWDPLVIGVEKVAYQEALIQHLRLNYPSLRIKEIPTAKDKTSRAYLRSGLFENGKIFVRKDMHLFIDELCLFPDSQHDDQFDGFDFALGAADLESGQQVSGDFISTSPDFGGLSSERPATGPRITSRRQQSESRGPPGPW